ncbi:MAG: hypothetical protein WB778_01535 [Thermoplasmata archaeon]
MPQMDVDTVLLSVQEREKWRHRMELLAGSLSDVRARRRKLERQLRRVRKELARLVQVSDVILRHGTTITANERTHATRNFQYAGR